jgi:uncharacterized protein YndB with AHSA1/START domain
MLKPVFHYVSYIQTTPEQLWQALTDSKFTTRPLSPLSGRLRLGR